MGRLENELEPKYNRPDAKKNMEKQAVSCFSVAGSDVSEYVTSILISMRLLTSTAAEPNWKPISLRAPFLLAVIALSIGLIVTLQFLLLQSSKNGGILFTDDVDTLPLSRTFSYTYLPTILAVIYAFMWNWIDLDARRLEPFLQMAKDNGATGTGSLLLHYPVDFLASVPIKALKQGSVSPLVWEQITDKLLDILPYSRLQSPRFLYSLV